MSFTASTRDKAHKGLEFRIRMTIIRGHSPKVFFFAFLLLASSKAFAAQSCNSNDIANAIQQLEQLQQSQLESLASCREQAVQPLISALGSDNLEVRSKTVRIFYLMENSARNATEALLLISLNKNEDISLRTSAIDALQVIHPRDSQTILALLDIIREEKNSQIRMSSALALATNSTGENEVIGTLINIINKRDDDSVRYAAAYAIGEIAKSYKEIVRPIATKSLLNALRKKEQDRFVVVGCIHAVKQLGLTDRSTILILLNLLKHQDVLVRKQAANTLTNIANEVYSQTSTIQEINSQLPIVEEIQSELALLGLDKEPDIQKSIQVINTIVENFKIKRQTLLLQVARQWVIGDRAVWIIHPLFWLFLIFAYPKFPQIQAIFFWHKAVRDIFGLGYVSLLLTWVPPLRCRLFSPFKDSLLADAKLDVFKTQFFFSESEVKLKGTNQVQPIDKVLPEIKGQIIIEGESGLGKTMLLRHLVRQSKRIVVYLPAQKCEKGVIEAIQAKLHGQAQDAEFLRNLIYSGAIDICIDGLNEVKAEVRANITAFVESYFKGNIIMTTQPLVWNPPATAKTYVLQSLRRNQIEQFLSLCQHRLPPTVKLQGTKYEEACTQYLNTALNDQQDPDELAVAKRILSNPMDLSVVAQMIANGIQPDLFRLQEQQYKLMAEDYERSWNQHFPLKQFSEFVYQMRDKDESAMSGDTFHQALAIMEQEPHRMVLSRQWKDKNGDEKMEWSFRHDKIMEFFLIQPFLRHGDEGVEKRKKHIGDPRFRGIYFLLATLLPRDEALALREDLIQYAARTQDHTVSDIYVQLVK